MNILPKDLVSYIYLFDNTYHKIYKKINNIFAKFFTFQEFLISKKGTKIFIYNDKKKFLFCASIQNPQEFYKNLNKEQIYDLSDSEYSVKYKYYNKKLGVQLWFNETHYEFIKNILIKKR